MAPKKKKNVRFEDAGGDNAGAPTLEETRRFRETADMSQVSQPIIPDLRGVPAEILNRGDQAEIKAYFLKSNEGHFPIRPFPHDPYDKVWDTKMGLVTGPDSVVSAKRPLPFTDEDILYLEGKAAAEEYSAFQTWEADRYDLSNPATKDWYAKVNPGYFEQREQLIDDLIETQANYAKIRLRGPRSEEDLKLEYMIETGRVKLPEGPVWAPFATELRAAGVLETDTAAQMLDKVADRNLQVYNSGIFSPLQAITPIAERNSVNNQMAWSVNAYNKGDVRGDPQRPFTGSAYGTLPPDRSNVGELYSGPQLGLLRRKNLYDVPESQYSTAVKLGWGNSHMRRGHGMVVGGPGYPPENNDDVNADPAVAGGLPGVGGPRPAAPAPGRIRAVLGAVRGYLPFI